MTVENGETSATWNWTTHYCWWLVLIMDPITISARMQIPMVSIMVVWIFSTDRLRDDERLCRISVLTPFHIFMRDFWSSGKLVASPDNFRAKRWVNRSLENDKGNAKLIRRYEFIFWLRVTPFRSFFKFLFRALKMFSKPEISRATKMRRIPFAKM